jgi:GNAT superfamily N-acetyltransferase
VTIDGVAVPAGHRLVTVSDEPALWRPADDMCSSVWPEFMRHDPAADRNWPGLRDHWPEFQLVLLDSANGIAAVAQAAPLWWNGDDDGLPEGWDAQFDRSTADLHSGRAPNTLGAIQICVAPDRRGQGLSSVMVEAMRLAGTNAGYGALIACVRPAEKARYPLMPIDTYTSWRRSDGLPFDPWLRVHARAGARIVRPAPHSMTISGTVAEWREWTGLSFPVSGPYAVAGALAPVEMALEEDRGVYYDPNVWMVHPLS